MGFGWGTGILFFLEFKLPWVRGIFWEFHEILKICEFRDRYSGTVCESIIGWWEKNCVMYCLFCLFYYCHYYLLHCLIKLSLSQSTSFNFFQFSSPTHCGGGTGEKLCGPSCWLSGQNMTTAHFDLRCARRTTFVFNRLLTMNDNPEGQALFLCSQNQRKVGVGRDLWGSSCATSLPNQVHLQ